MVKECDKISFSSAEEADKEIKRQLETQQRPWAKRDTKNCRKYKCKCGKWHLTSKITIIEY